MKSRRIILGALSCVLGITSITGRAAYAEGLDSWKTCCGAVCLRVVSALLNQQHELSEIRVLLQPNDQGETSLKEIQETARQLGMYAVGCRIRGEALEQCATPVIAHWKPNHFVVLIGLGQGRGVSIIDAPHACRSMTKEELDSQEHWSVVAIANRPISARGILPPDEHQGAGNVPQQNGPMKAGNVELDSKFWFFGNVVEGVRASHQFAMKNSGAKPVFLDSVKSSCPCLVVDRWDGDIPPDKTGGIDVTFDTSGILGPVRKSIAIAVRQEGDESPTILQLGIFGLVMPQDSLMITPTVLRLGEVVKGETVRKVIRVRRLGYAPLDYAGIKADSAVIRGERIGSDGPMSQDAEIELSITADAVGDLEHTVAIQTNHKTHPSADIIILGSVVPAVRVEPCEIFLGMLSNHHSLKTSFMVRNVMDRPFLITRATTDYPGITCTFDGNKTGPRAVWQMNLEVADSAQVGLIKGNVILETSDGDTPTLKVPFLGYASQGYTKKE